MVKQLKINQSIPILTALLGMLLAVVYHYIARVAGTPLMLNLDDGYIHARIAEVFADSGRIGINPMEGGGGSSSTLWTLLLTIEKLLGIHGELGAFFSSLFSWGFAVWAVSRLAFQVTTKLRALLIALLIAGTGQLAALALSGMETHLVLACLAMSLEARSKQGAKRAILWASLASLVRPEAALLAFAYTLNVLLIKDTKLKNKIRNGLNILIIPLLSAFFGLLFLTVFSGSFPSMIAGRRWLIELPQFPWNDLILSCQAALQLILQLDERMADYIGPAYGFGFLWMMIVRTLALLGMINWWKDGKTKREMLFFLILHSLFYLILLPTPGHLGRYFNPVWVLTGLLVVSGWEEVANYFNQQRIWNRIRPYLAVALILGMLPQIVRWGAWNRQAMEHLRQVHFLMAKTISEMKSDEGKFAAFDIGILSYFGCQRLVDLGGLTDSEMAQALHQGTVPSLLEKRRVSYIILPEVSGNLRYIFARKLGLDIAGLQEIARFSFKVKNNRYLHATNVAFPALGLYKWNHE